MTPFSASDAALEGFQVLARHWRVALGWALFYVVAAAAVVVGAAIIGVVMVELGAVRSETLQAVIGPLVGLVMLLGVPLMLAAGVYRLMLRPEEPGFLHLRLGPAELRLLGVWALLGAALAAAGFAAAFALGAASSVASAWVAFPLALIAVVAVWLLVARLSLLQAVSFAEGRIRLGLAWRLTRGRTWALFGMSVISACLLAMIGVVTWIVLFLIGGAISGFQDFGLSDAESLTSHPGRYLFEAVAELILTPVFIVIAHAPVAAAYKALCTPEA
jgi:hypothetical protein